MKMFDIFKKKTDVQEEPTYFVRGKLSDGKIHLGSYFLNPGDREDCYLIFEDNRWCIPHHYM